MEAKDTRVDAWRMMVDDDDHGDGSARGGGRQHPRNVSHGHAGGRPCCAVLRASAHTKVICIIYSRVAVL